MNIGIGIGIGLGARLAGGGGVIPLEFLLRDDFLTAESAPLASPRTAEPGPGTLVIADTNNVLSISGGKLNFATGGVVIGDPGVWGESLERVVGRAVVGRATPSNIGIEIGFDSNQSASIADSIRLIIGAGMVRANATAIAGDVFTAAEHVCVVVARSAGFFAFVKGGAFTNWTLLWVGVAGTAALFPGVTVAAATVVAVLDTLRVLDLAAPFDTDYGLATQRLAGAVSVNTVFVHEADCLIEYIATTLPSSGVLDVRFREQDGNNYWRVRITTVGTLQLHDIVDGAANQRASVTEIVSAGHRIVVVANDETIRVYSNNVLRITYASATNFATETAGRLISLGTGGVASDIVSWPRQISGEAAALLDAAVAA